MTSSYEFANNPRQYAEQILQDSQEALTAAVAAVLPEQPDADPLQVFPATGELRNEDFGDPDFVSRLSEAQVVELRAAAARLGFERPTDATASSLGLINAHVIIEGGQPHKMAAEAGMIMDDTAAHPATLIFAGSPYRRIESEAEKASARRQFGEVPETEYDAARKVAEGLPGFVPLDEDEVLPLGYDIQNHFAVTDEASGQFVQIGNVADGTIVVMFRVDREPYTDEQGQAKYRKQPGTIDVLRIVDGVSTMLGDETLPIAFVTSGTYQPSRSVDAATAALETNRVVGVPTYGTARLAAVNGTEVPEPKRLDQLPGELHKMAEQVVKLEQALA